MSIDTVRKVMAVDINLEDELDLDGDEYGDNEKAITGYAIVEDMLESWDDENDYEPVVVFSTSQGRFTCPASHYLKVKVD